MSTVKMVNSVGEHTAGEEVELPDEQADHYILLGYAEGTLSRDYSAEERAKLESRHQGVSLGG
jgi:hypothetical protein